MKSKFEGNKLTNHKKFEENSPLISVVAFSYNQVGLVIETLDSIYNQDYLNLELVVTDDGSIDGTQEIVLDWINKHRSRFVNVKEVFSKENYGVCHNISKGLSATTGEWIKPIACDDILRNDAISTLLMQAKNDSTELVFSQLEKFKSIDGVNSHLGMAVSDVDVHLITGSINKIINTLGVRNFLPAPSAFYSKNLYKKSGGINLDFKHLDDWPLWLKMLPHLNIIGWTDECLVKYRISDGSVSKTKIKPIAKLLYDDTYLFFDLVQKNILGSMDCWDIKLFLLRKKLTYSLFGNTWFGYYLVMPIQIMSPIFILRNIKKLVLSPAIHGKFFSYLRKS